MYDYRRHFVRSPDVCAGMICIRGTRVPLRTVLACLAEGATVAEIVEDYPTLTEDDVRAVIAFAAAAVGEEQSLPFGLSLP